MTKKERENLKQEIIAEVLNELQKQGANAKPSAYNYDTYRSDVVKDDLAKVEAFIKGGKKWKWFIPLVGIYIYGYHAQQMINSMDRGAMRVAITRYQVRSTAWYILMWIICLPMIINIQTFVDWHVYKKAVAEVKQNLETKKQDI